MPNFGQTNFKCNLEYLVSFLATCYALWLGDYGLAALALVIHVLVISIFSAVTHRYFCHHAYQANPTLMWALSVIPPLYGFSTPIHWTVMHSAHHQHADTELDPHEKGWRGTFTAAYKDPPIKYIRATKWFTDEKHKWVARNSFLLLLAWNAALFLISPQVMLWVGLVPMFTLLFSAGLHRTFSHAETGVRNLWFLEYIVPMGGEWIHDEHHVKAGKVQFANKWFEIDTGWFLVKLLAR